MMAAAKSADCWRRLAVINLVSTVVAFSVRAEPAASTLAAPKADPVRAPALPAVAKSPHEVIALYLGAIASNLSASSRPTPPTAPVRIGVLAREDPFGGALERTFAGATANGRPLVVVRGRTAGTLPDCDIVFLDLPRNEDVKPVLAALAPRRIVTTAFRAGFLEAGGAIEFLPKPDDQGLAFRLNLTALRKAGFEPSAGLIRVSLKPIVDAENPPAAPGVVPPSTAIPTYGDMVAALAARKEHRP
jgi:hypothetical protein